MGFKVTSNPGHSISPEEPNTTPKPSGPGLRHSPLVMPISISPHQVLHLLPPTQCPHRPGPLHGWVMTSHTLFQSHRCSGTWPGWGSPGHRLVWVEGTLNPTSFPPPAMAMPNSRFFSQRERGAAQAVPPPFAVETGTLSSSFPSHIPPQHPLPTPTLLPSFPPVQRWVILPISVAQANQALLLRSFSKSGGAQRVSEELVGDSRGCAGLGALLGFLKELS